MNGACPFTRGRRGLHYRVQGPRAGGLLARGIPGARRVTLPDASRLRVLEQPVAFTEALDDGLEAVAA